MAAPDPEILDLVRSHMSQVKVPSHSDKVYKDECGFSFATTVSQGGLYINLATFQAYAAEWVELDHSRTGQVLYLHEQGTKVPKEDSSSNEKPTELAIGTESGFADSAAPKYDVIMESALVLVPAGIRIGLPCPDLPELILQSIAAIQAHDSARHQDEVAAWTDERRVSKYAASLEQLPATRLIPMDPAQWKCDETGVTDNLWLNLSTGFIGSGRPHWDGTGGNGAALRHFEAMGSKYPLAVKLGTITPTSADVYSYAPDEDDMVVDPLLAEHLAHWGINIQQMSKTEATMTELQIQKNLEHEFDRITEAGEQLVPLHGPGHIGLKNLGNSCYMNSTLQALWTLPELEKRYLAQATTTFETAPRDVPEDILSQWVKVGRALVQGITPRDHIAGEEDSPALTAVEPAVFKALIGRGHPEFSTQRQQDAEEYFVHLLDTLVRAERPAGNDRLPGSNEVPAPHDLFEIELEDRIQCTVSGRVTYKKSKALTLGLNIPRELIMNSTNRPDGEVSKRQKVDEEGDSGGNTMAIEEPSASEAAEEEENGKDASIRQETEQQEEGSTTLPPEISFDACLEAFFADLQVDGVYSAALQQNAPAAKRTRIAAFPEYLVVQLRRYYVAEDWTARKLDVAVPMPDVVDLERFRGLGLQPDEEPQPESNNETSTAEPVSIDESQVSQLVDMGFGENASRRAVAAVQGAGPEAAMEWLLGHMDDADINDPLTVEQGNTLAQDPEKVASLTAMGFTSAAASKALQATGNDIERAADWLFSRMDDLGSLEDDDDTRGAAGDEQQQSTTSVDGPGRYELIGFISHMGANTACGHYVAHIRKNNQWVLFNDEKVAVSQCPPKELGYLYFYRRAV